MSETVQAGREGGAGTVGRHVVLLLGAAGGPVPTADHMHKTLYHVSRAVPELEAAARFTASETGPRSAEVDGAVRALAASGLAEAGPGGYALTGAGRAEFARQSGAAARAAEKAEHMKSFYNPLSRDELLAVAYFADGAGVPCLRSGPECERVSRMRGELADGMHRGDRLGIGTAARVAGVCLEDYMEAERARGRRTEWGAEQEPLGALPPRRPGGGRGPEPARG